jgi:DNA-binding transcriptional LysR family regulator
MSDRLQELAVFVRAAESGSFSRAARELGLSQPSVSRIVGELEARLGVTLLLRTTHSPDARTARMLLPPHQRCRRQREPFALANAVSLF